MTKINEFPYKEKESAGNLPWDTSKLTHEDRKKLCKKYAPDTETEIACGAPLCPLFGWTGIFYSDEEICSRSFASSIVKSPDDCIPFFN